MSAVLVAICLALTYICTKTTYWIFKVFVGFFWWGLAFYWVQLPASTNPSLQTMLVLLPIGCGIGCLFWAFWTAKTIRGETIEGFKLPFMKSEDDDETRTPLTRNERVDNYSRRVSGAINGRRQRR